MQASVLAWRWQQRARSRETDRHAPPLPHGRRRAHAASMQRLALRAPAAARAAPCAAPARRRAVAVRAGGGEPAHVTEAREWVERWKARQAAGGAPAGGKGKKAAAAAAPAGGGKLEACKSLPDGTLVFTAERLKSVKFDDVKL